MTIRGLISIIEASVATNLLLGSFVLAMYRALAALATAGFTQFANTKGIYLLRMENGKQQKIPVPYRALIKGEAIDQNLVLKPGDTIVVP